MSLVGEVMPVETPTPSDHEFRYLGLTESQIRLLDGQPNHLRQIIYDEAIMELMENGPGYGGHHTVEI